MLLTFAMFAAGVGAGLCQIVAHWLMRGRTYATPIPRYGVGAGVALVWFSFAYFADTRQDAIAGIWYIFGASGVGTWIAYELDKKPATEEDLMKFAPHIAAEHDETDTRGSS